MVEKPDLSDVKIPEDEEDVVDMVAETHGREWAEEHRELVIAQAELIGDL